MLTFQWDSDEAVAGDAHLTPVYFRREVLIRYFYDARFDCEFVSDTYGTIRGREFIIPFGIVPSGNVIVWLGDLMKAVPKREQFYWLVENIAPEGDHSSEFYEAQVNAEFTEPTHAVRVLNKIEALNSAFERRLGVPIYKELSICERLEAVSRYKRLLHEGEDDFKRFISELNEIVNENVNARPLRKLLEDNEVQFDSASKGNKLVEKVYAELLEDEDNLIAPFFYLYDLRIWADHSRAEENLRRVRGALGLGEHASYSDLWTALLDQMEASVDALLERCDA